MIGWFGLKGRHLADSDVFVRAFKACDADAFASLNLRWIKEYFGVEGEDQRVLTDPNAAIIEPGGYIAIAEIDGAIVGTGAIKHPADPSNHGEGWMELVKMATDPAAQGKGVGMAVLQHLIEQARRGGATHLWLETNDRLQAATRLYARAGFQPLSDEETHPTPYSRCNLQMVLEL